MIVHRRCATRGFTYAEMLVVLGIVITLLATLVPVYDKVLISSNRVQCINNLKQIGSCLQLYAALQKGALPNNNPLSVAGGNSWNQACPPWPVSTYWTGGSPSAPFDAGIVSWQVGYLFDQCGATANIFMCPAANMTTSFLQGTYTAPASPNIYGKYTLSQWAFMTYAGSHWDGTTAEMIPTTYQYFGAVSDFTYTNTPASGADGLVTINPTNVAMTTFENINGVNTSVTLPIAPSPWGRIQTGSTVYYGSQISWAAGPASGTAPGLDSNLVVTLKPADLTNPPLMSDLVMIIPAGYKFGINSAHSIYNTAYFSHGSTLDGSLCLVLYADYSVSDDTIRMTAKTPTDYSAFLVDNNVFQASSPVTHYR